jgi:hypothetical protein
VEENDLRPNDAAVDRVLNDLNRADDVDGGIPLVRTSTGALLRPKKLPDLLVQQLWSRFPIPQPPTVEVRGHGKTWREPNPDDPTYRRALQQRTLDVGEAMLRLTLLRGVEVVELPANVLPYEQDTEWLEDMEYLGVTLPESKAGRYVEWLRYRVVVTNEDFIALQRACTRLAGVTEEDVQAATELFPGAS